MVKRNKLVNTGDEATNPEAEVEGFVHSTRC